MLIVIIILVNVKGLHSVMGVQNACGQLLLSYVRLCVSSVSRDFSEGFFLPGLRGMLRLYSCTILCVYSYQFFLLFSCGCVVLNFKDGKAGDCAEHHIWEV